jgi:hypothetical protein
MIFKETMQKQEPFVKEAIEDLFKKAADNQTHTQDILLIIEHGFYYPILAKPDIYETHKLSPYVIGQATIGHSERTQYEFYNWYRQSHKLDLNVFLENLRNDKNLEEAERNSIEIEKSIYLKFWESDMILKYFHQLVNSANGNSYDWHLTIPSEPREGSKHELIRKKIRDLAKDICPKFYQLIKETYLTQLRNAIAHSQYYFAGRRIGYNNYSEDPQAHCPLRSLSFDEWSIYFHNTLLTYNELIGNLNKWRDYYYQKTIEKGSIEIRITKSNSEILIKELGLRNGFKSWVWLENV